MAISPTFKSVSDSVILGGDAEETQTLNHMNTTWKPLLWGALIGSLFAFQTHAQEPAYLPLESPNGGSDWGPDIPDLTDPDATPWNHDNGSDQWEGVLGIVDGGDMPGGVELLEQDGAEFLRFQDARTSGGSGDNRKIMFTANIDEEAGTDPLNVDDGVGVTLHVRLRLAAASQGLPLDDIFEGDAWPEGGDGTRVRFGGKGSMGIDTEAGTFGFALGLADGDEALVDADGEPFDGLMLNGVAGGDEDGNAFPIPAEELTDWQEFWFQIIPEEGDDGSTHKVTLYHNGSIEGTDFAVTPGDANVGGAPEPSLYFGHAATDHIGAFDIDFIHVKEGIHEPIPAQGSDPNVIWSRRSSLGQVPTVPATTEGVVTIRNNGETNTLTLSNWGVSGADADHVTISEGPTEIAPGATADLKYIFDSKNETGAFNATITFDSNDPDTPNAAIAVSASVINTEGPGGHYPLDDVANEDLVLADITGYDRPGTYASGDGAVTFGQTALATGQAATLTGGASLQVPAKKFGDITNYTATTWLNVSEITGQLGAVISRATINDSNPATSLLLGPDGSLLWLAPDVSENPLFTIDPVIEFGTTYHLAVVAEGDHDKVTVYLNGESIGGGESLGAALPSEVGSFFFGAFGPLATVGTYDDLQVYTRALSAEDVATLAANPGEVLRPEDPDAIDSDGDGLSDTEEVALGTDAVKADTDGDGLSDGDEVNVSMTDPLLVDSDGDGLEDGVEIDRGTDPLDPADPKRGAQLTIEETGLGGDSPAQFNVLDVFEEDALTFSDRTHEHNSAAFDSGSGLLSTEGDLVVSLPNYLVGRPYVKFANNARDQDDYEATVTSDEPVQWYLLLDNRINGPAENADSSNDSDPELGGTFQWVIDGGWERVNTGISPEGQADYTGVDEGGDGGLNQFYAVYTLTGPSMAVTVRNNGTGGSNMISLVAGSAPLNNGGSGPPVELEVTEEEGLDGDDPAIVENAAYGEDALTFSDRTHEHNGAAFDSATGAISAEGDLVIDLPDYLVGQSYVRFANNAGENPDFQATVTASGPAKWYLLIDNRLDGPGGVRKSNEEDPILGGTLQWIIDGGWERVHTGISPNGQPDYVGVDERGDGSLNQFYAVFTLPEVSDTVTIRGNAIDGTNMLSLVGAGAPVGGEGLAGLAGYWRLDEQNGATAADSSGNGHDGAVEAADNAWVNDPERGAVYQSGNGSFINLGDTVVPVLDAATDFTWSFWVKPAETDNNNIVFGNRWSPDGTDFDPREFIKFTPRVFEWHFNGGGENVGGAETMFVVDQWSHNLVVKSGTTITYYRDGAEIASGEVTGNPANPQPLYLGGQNGNEIFAGLFDEVAIFDRALSTAEVTDVYNRGLNGQALNEGGDGVDPGPGPGLPELQNVGITANGVFGVTIPDGVTANIEYSTDLMNWDVIATGVTGAIEETDAGRIAAPGGFYRAVQP